MATTQIGTTVLCLNPNPNGRKLPSSLYTTEGFTIWTIVNDKMNNKMAIFTLLKRTYLLLSIIFITIFYVYNFYYILQLQNIIFHLFIFS